MSTELSVVLQENPLETVKAKDLLSQFEDFFKQAKGWKENALKIIVTEESQVELMSQAREARKTLQDIRIATEKTRVRLKEQSLREGKAIDGMANIIKAVIIPLEEHLMEQEKFVENKRIAREAALREERNKMMADIEAVFVTIDLGTLSQEDFDTIYSSAKSSFEQAKAHQLKVEQDRILAEEKAEKERIAAQKEYEARQEKIRKENERLKKEAEARAKEQAAQFAKIEAEREKERAIAAAKEKELERKRQEEAEARAKLENEKREREEKEAKEKAALIERQRQEGLASDKEKLLGFAEKIKQASPLSVDKKEAQEIAKFIKQELFNLATKIEERVKSL